MLIKFFFISEIATYKALLDESRWDILIEQFRQENYRLFQLASQSVFTVALQAGLSALKTPYPFTQNINFIGYSNSMYIVTSKVLKVKVVMKC